MINKKDTLVLYTSGVCNLNCRYCGIDKNPILKDIDLALAKSFEGDYYFNFIKKEFPNRSKLQRLETWGGEPFLYMERIYPLLHQLINYYPYLNTLYSSTNFSFPNWNDKIFDLLNQFAQYPYRNFTLELQLSCDGPEDINDAGRGINTTKKCLNNFNIFLSQIKEKCPSNVFLKILIKPTIDIINLKKINNKEKIIEYYQFFEDNFIRPFLNLNLSNSFINMPIPNLAQPIPASKQDGIEFAKFCKLTREIEEENNICNYFQFYKEITFYTSDINYPSLTYNYPYHTCGTGTSLIGLLPDNMYSTCHEGFTHFIEKYKQYAATSDRQNTHTISFDKFIEEQRMRYCVNEKNYRDFERQMNYYNEPNTKARLANLALEISVLAMDGQIEKKYMDPQEALKAAIFIHGHSAMCIKDNFNITGSITLYDYGLIKMFCNGAISYIEKNI